MYKDREKNLPEIVPAILTDSEEELIRFATVASKFAKRIQFDFMDSQFVPSQSVAVDSVLSIPKTTASFEAHLMVFGPEKHFEVLSEANFETVIFHIEVVKEPLKIIERARSYGLKPGIAINPDTSIESIGSLYKDVEEILFMTVYPGYYGRPIVWEALLRAKEFKEKHPESIVGIDGGVKLENIDKIVETGADRICIGSAIFRSEDFERSYQQFVDIVASVWRKKL